MLEIYIQIFPNKIIEYFNNMQVTDFHLSLSS